MAQLTFSPDVGHTPHKVSMMISGMQSYMHRAEQALPACDLFLMVFRLVLIATSSSRELDIAASVCSWTRGLNSAMKKQAVYRRLKLGNSATFIAALQILYNAQGGSRVSGALC